MTVYDVAEVFTSVQGEGVYTGTPMTFVRFTGCSVGKKICHACDTDFDRTYPWRGGGSFTTSALVEKMHTKHICFTGGEPLNQDLLELFEALEYSGKVIHIETSGTVEPSWLPPRRDLSNPAEFRKILGVRTWVTVSPKPGYLESMLLKADELKVIVPGLGSGDGWPGIDLALRFADLCPVYLQPRNEKSKVHSDNLALVYELVLAHSQLRMSVQMHKYISVR